MKNAYVVFLSIIMIVIVGSGLAIYSWNLLHGRDLSKPPQLTASSFPDLDDYLKIQDLMQDILGENMNDNLAPAAENSLDAVQNNFQLLNGYIYFKNSFRLNSAVQTNELIASFLNDFPELKKMSIENLAARKIVILDLSKIPRLDLILVKLKKNKDIASFNEKTSELQFKQEKYKNEIVDLLNAIAPDIMLKTDFPNNQDYIARLKYGSTNAAVSQALEKLKADYGDLVLVK